MEDRMSNDLDLKVLERKAWRSAFQDGLWDIYLGLILVAFAVSAWLDKQPIKDDLQMGIYIGVMVFGMVVLYVGKRFITIPRMGTVKFGASRQKRRKVVQLVLFISLLVGLLLWWLSASALGRDGGMPTKWMFPAFWVLNTLFVFGAGAYFLNYERLYVIGFFYALSLPLDVFVKQVTKIDMDVYIFLGAGLIVVVMGVVYLLRFLRDYQPVELRQGQ
jgi:hypothetical protein